ncbi:MAG: sigma 54-interacting transcriptional regulator, partial [Clostridia bacterium]|nr:sigma 54-interacting transcriptional regulator [Clostridia bacterium]
LDELNALPFHVQGKLLRVLQEGTFRPIGASAEKKVNVKVIAAMNVDPVEAMENNILRKDLFYRLSGSMIYLPPLRERKNDIEYLIDNYLDLYNNRYAKNVEGISDELRNFFLNYGWEGNVRELKHVIESMVSITKNNVLKLSEVPLYLSNKASGISEAKSDTPEGQLVLEFSESDMNLRDGIEKLERSIITAALKKSKGNKTHAGEILGIPRQTLKYKMNKYGIADIEK